MQQGQHEKFQRLKTLRERPWIYRNSTLFVYLGTFIGVCFTLSPIIYSLTHTEEEERAFKQAMGLKVTK